MHKVMGLKLPASIIKDIKMGALEEDCNYNLYILTCYLLYKELEKKEDLLSLLLECRSNARKILEK